MSQEQDELWVFQQAAKRIGLPVIAESIAKRDPPEPDILCRLDDGTSLAVELAEICHPDNAAFFGRASRLAQLIDEAHAALPSHHRARFDARFAGKPLSVDFDPHVSTNRIRAMLARLFAELLTATLDSTGTYRDFSPDLRRVVGGVRIAGRVYEPDEPSFNLSGPFNLEDVVLHTVAAKLDKTYRTDYPVELIAYFDAFAAGWMEDWRTPLRDMLVANGLGPFRRVWVLTWRGKPFFYRAS